MSSAVADPVEKKEWRVLDYDPKNWQVLNVLGVLKVAAVGGAMGVTEEGLLKQSGLEPQDFLRQVGHLEQAGLIESFVSQVGTSGPWARRYRILPRVEIKITY